jgi:hypothetical protein
MVCGVIPSIKSNGWCCLTLRVSFYTLSVVHGECFGILAVQGFISEVLWWITTCIYVRRHYDFE